MWRLVALVGAVAVAGSIGADVMFGSGPWHAARCLMGGRDGWFVEYPTDAVTADQIRDVIPSCVPVHIGYVDWNEVGEGELAIVPFGRDWFAHDDSLALWVEGSAAQATDPCRPLGPSRGALPGCPGGVQPRPLRPGATNRGRPASPTEPTTSPPVGRHADSTWVSTCIWRRSVTRMDAAGEVLSEVRHPKSLVPPAGFEPATPGLGTRCEGSEEEGESPETQ